MKKKKKKKKKHIVTNSIKTKNSPHQKKNLRKRKVKHRSMCLRHVSTTPSHMVTQGAIFNSTHQIQFLVCGFGGFLTAECGLRDFSCLTREHGPQQWKPNPNHQTSREPPQTQSVCSHIVFPQFLTVSSLTCFAMLSLLQWRLFPSFFNIYI